MSRVISKGRSLGELAYKRNVVRIFVAQGAAVLPAPAGLSVQVEEGCTPHGPVYDLMRRATHWQDEEMARRRAFGDVCYAAYDQGRCVHYSWLTSSTRVMEEAGCIANLAFQNAWIYNCYTAPEHRGRSVYPFVLAHIVTAVQTLGGGRVWIDVLDENAASLRGVLKAGFEEVAAVERGVALSRLTLSRQVIVVNQKLTQVLRTFGPDWMEAAP